jgi:hypothetical protein
MDTEGKGRDRMRIHANTVLGFLEAWGRSAKEEEVGVAVGVLLGRLADRELPSRLQFEGLQFTFSKDTQLHRDQVREAFLQMREWILMRKQSPEWRRG